MLNFLFMPVVCVDMYFGIILTYCSLFRKKNGKNERNWKESLRKTIEKLRKPKKNWLKKD